MNVNKAYEVEQGLLVENGPFYTGGSASPVGQGMPSNTIYVQNTASGILVWQKFGAGDTASDWRFYPAAGVSFDVSALTAQSLDLVGLTQTQQVVSALANRHFGKRFQTDVQLGEVTRTSTDYFTSNTISYTGLPTGKYFINMNYDALKTLTNNRAERRFTVNGSTVYETEVSIADDDIYYGFTSSYVADLSGNVTINFDLRKSANGLLGGQVKFRNRQLSVWRIS